MTAGDFAAENNGKSLSSYFAWLARDTGTVFRRCCYLTMQALAITSSIHEISCIFTCAAVGGVGNTKRKKRGRIGRERESEKKLNKYPTGKEIFLFEL